MTQNFPVSFTDANGVTRSNNTVEFMDAGGGADPDLPLVILLHGLLGSASNMTNPDYNYNNMFAVPATVDRGWHWYPNAGVWSFEEDPLMTVTSWRKALNTAGFPTLVYNQIGNNGFLASPTLELKAIMEQVVLQNFANKKLAFVAHSRGGLLLRNFLVGCRGENNFLNRIVSAVTLHSPNQGTELANIGSAVIAAIDALSKSPVAGAGAGFAAVLNWLRAQVDCPALQELRVSSPFLAALAAKEPVPGIRYHTFGGTSTRWIRVRSNTFTAGSLLPQWNVPPFHWFTVPVQLISLLDGVPGLSALAPELRSGSGDTLVTNARAHLSFSASRHTNALNHAEPLFDPTLQKQVINILRAAVGKPPLP